MWEDRMDRLLATTKETSVLHIDATSSNATSADILKILKMTNLPMHTISLYNYRVGNAGAVEIARLLITMSIIQLSLFVDSIDSGLVDIANALYFNRTLKFLHICCVEINNTQCRALAHMLRQNTSLESMILDSNNLTSGNCCSILNQLKYNAQLKSLVIQNNDITARVIITAEKILRVNKNLAELTLCGIKTNRTANLAIKISGSRQDLNKQINMLRIEKVYIDKCYGSIIDIILNTRTFNLDLFMTDTDIMNFLITLFNNQKIMINLTACLLNKYDRCDMTNLLNILKQSETIKSLNLNSNDMYYINGAIESLVDTIKNNATITILNLSGCYIDDYNNQIFEAVEYNGNISELYLSDCSIDMYNIDHITKFFKNNTTLKILDLSFNNNWHYDSDNLCDSMINIFDSLSHNETLCVLYLNNNIPEIYTFNKMVSSVIGCLETNYTLTDLGIFGVNDAIDYDLERNKIYQSEKRFIKIKPV